MAVQQVYVFDIGSEVITSAIATDGKKVQYLHIDEPRDSEINQEAAREAEQSIVIGAKEGIEPMASIAGNMYALVTPEIEFSTFDAAADAAQELFDREATAREFKA